MDIQAIMAAHRGDPTGLQERIIYRDMGGNDDK